MQEQHTTIPTLSPEAEDELLADFLHQEPNLLPLARKRDMNLDQLIAFFSQPRIKRKLRDLERLARVKLRACRSASQLCAYSRLADLSQFATQEETSRKSADAILRAESRRAVAKTQKRPPRPPKMRDQPGRPCPQPRCESERDPSAPASAPKAPTFKRPIPMRLAPSAKVTPSHAVAPTSPQRKRTREDRAQPVAAASQARPPPHASRIRADTIRMNA